jgi:hypothetical protein
LLRETKERLKKGRENTGKMTMKSDWGKTAEKSRKD